MRSPDLNSRIQKIAKVTEGLPELGSPDARVLKKWVQRELGDLCVLSEFCEVGGKVVRAVPPQTLLVIGAGNLSVSLWQAILVGWILGAELWIKPATGSEYEYRLFLKRVPAFLKNKMRFLKHAPAEIIRAADAVIALGSDETLEEIQGVLHPKQRFVAYGHRTSAIWVGDLPDSPRIFDCIVQDVTQYAQQGCLSPRWIWLDSKVSRESFMRSLSESFERWENKSRAKRSLNRSEQALIYECRQIHVAVGNRVFGSKKDLSWTLIEDRVGGGELSTLPRVIFVRSVTEKNLKKEFSWISGDLSSVGVYSSMKKSIESLLISWGAVRFCKVGEMQSPAVDWLHDGRPQLSDLVRWVEKG